MVWKVNTNVEIRGFGWRKMWNCLKILKKKETDKE